MKPPASSPSVSRTMSRVRSKGTKPETAIRSALFAQGARYRVQYRPIELEIGRSSIDIAMPGIRLAIFVDGCFWHKCPIHGTVPKANHDWWEAKLAANCAVDQRVTNQLRTVGWTVLRFWTHSNTNDIVSAVLAEASRLRQIKNDKKQ